MPDKTRPAGRKRNAPLPPHGTRSRYQHREKPCSCKRCKAANTADQRARRQRRRWEQLELDLSTGDQFTG